MLEPFICHVFTKTDRLNAETRKKHEKHLKRLIRTGTVGNYLFVSSKTGEGMDFLKQAIFDADIKGHGDRVRPYDLKTEQKRLGLIKDGKKGKGDKFFNDDELDEDSDEDASRLKKAASYKGMKHQQSDMLGGLSKTAGRGSKKKDKDVDDLAFPDGGAIRQNSMFAGSNKASPRFEIEQSASPKASPKRSPKGNGDNNNFLKSKTRP